jgi:hypothetical protein
MPSHEVKKNVFGAVIQPRQSDGPAERSAVEIVMCYRFGLARAVGLKQIRIQQKILVLLVEIAVIVPVGYLQNDAVLLECPKAGKMDRDGISRPGKSRRLVSTSLFSGLWTKASHDVK